MQPTDYKKQFGIAQTTPSGVKPFNFVMPNSTGATSPAKETYVNNVVKSTSPTPVVTTPKPTAPVPQASTPTTYTTPSGAVVNADGSLKTPPAGVDPNSPVQTPSPADDAFSSYLKSLQQPDEVTAATKYVNNLITQGKQDQEKALETGETLGFATGEAARVGRQNSIALEAAGRGLDALVASNASKKEIAKARYDYEKAKLDAAKADKKTGFELSPGQKRYEYDPKTGAYKEVASVAPAPKAADKVTEGEKKAVMVGEVNDAANQLRQIVKAKGFEGISVDDYNEMRTYLSETYGYESLLELDKAIAAMGLIVDYNPDGKGTTKAK